MHFCIILDIYALMTDSAYQCIIHSSHVHSSHVPPGKLTWQWKMDLFKMYFLLNNDDFLLPC